MVDGYRENKMTTTSKNGIRFVRTANFHNSWVSIPITSFGCDRIGVLLFKEEKYRKTSPISLINPAAKTAKNSWPISDLRLYKLIM